MFSRAYGNKLKIAFGHIISRFHSMSKTYIWAISYKLQWLKKIDLLETKFIFEQTFYVVMLISANFMVINHLLVAFMWFHPSNKISDLDLKMNKLTCGYDFILSLRGLEFVVTASRYNFVLEQFFKGVRSMLICQKESCSLPKQFLSFSK